MLRVLKHARIPLFLHRKSKPRFHSLAAFCTVNNQTIRGQELPHVCRLVGGGPLSQDVPAAIESTSYTTLQKFTDRINGAVLERIIASFILLTDIKQIFLGTDSSGFKSTHASQYYTERAELRRRWVKL